MPFLQTGGLLVITTGPYRGGDEIVLLFTLMDEPEELTVAGRVVCITPEGVQ